MSEEWAESFAKDVGANKTVKIPLNFLLKKGSIPKDLHKFAKECLNKKPAI